MSVNSKIEWTDATWNPVTGCSKVSEGCRNCYALKFAERWRGTTGHYFENGFDITLRPNKLDEPMRWKKPRRIFVNSMSDLFHKHIPDDFIRQVFDVMAQTPEHTYQVLTKRAERMRDFVESYDPENLAPSPLPNVWLGVSVENQKAADERIPLLLQTPAAVRFLSCEPLLGPVDLSGWFFINELGNSIKPPIDWVITGGESGPGARPVHPDWIRSLRDQCQAAGVPFFFKQWGEWVDVSADSSKGGNASHIFGSDGYVFGAGFKDKGMVDEDWRERGGVWMSRVGKKSAGRELDGRTWDEFPEVR